MAKDPDFDKEDLDDKSITIQKDGDDAKIKRANGKSAADVVELSGDDTEPLTITLSDDDTVVEEKEDKKKTVKVAKEEDDTDDDADDRMAYESNDEDGVVEKKGRRAKRNARQKAARERENARIQALERQVEFYKESTANIAQSQVGLALHQIDGRMQQAKQAHEQATAAKIVALNSGEGERVVRLDELINRAANEYNGLVAARAQITAKPEQKQNGGRVQQEQTDPRAKKYADTFSSRNPWFDPTDESDDDSQELMAIDDKISAEGYRPDTPAYWQELERRAKAAGLGDTDDDEDDTTVVKKKANGGKVNGLTSKGGGLPPTGTVRSGTKAGTVQFTLSPFQKQALSDMELLNPTSTQDKARRDKIVRAWMDGSRKQRAAA